MSNKVVYWLSRAIRLEDNQALYLAQQTALKNNARLEVDFFLNPDFPHANKRNMTFLLVGLLELAKKLDNLNIPLIVRIGNPAESFMTRITDENIIGIVTEHAVLKPALTLQDQVRRVCERAWIDFHKVNTACVVPVEIASPKLEFAARTFRPKIMAQYPAWIHKSYPIVSHTSNVNTQSTFDKAQLSTLLQRYENQDMQLSDLGPGETHANRMLKEFIENGLPYYDRRNEVDSGGASKLSAYLHFGMLSPIKMIREVEASGNPNAPLFVEEALVRRELAENYCHYCKDYDSLTGAWPWARETLSKHREDPRPYLYTLEEFENAQTHDMLWNHAQKQVLEKGYLNSYLRMYWAKMVLLWSKSPEEAIRILIHLNDRYFLDGRDPNGYTGILWSVAGVHDRPWFDRPVFGLIRTMGSEGTLKKTKVKL